MTTAIDSVELTRAGPGSYGSIDAGILDSCADVLGTCPRRRAASLDVAWREADRISRQRGPAPGRSGARAFERTSATTE